MAPRRMHKDPSHVSRQDRLVREHEHDTYRQRRKPREPTACPDCGAIFRDGRWQWATEERNAVRTLRCPACARISDGVPAAFLTLTGRFLYEHRDEILSVMRNRAEHEGREHPLQRIMAIETAPGRIEATFTDAHLARGIGEALRHAYKGDLAYRYADGETLLRVSWHRDE